jgi:hypothetical protein
VCYVAWFVFVCCLETLVWWNFGRGARWLLSLCVCGPIRNPTEADGNGNVMEILWTRAVLAGGYRECVDKCQLSPMAKLVCLFTLTEEELYEIPVCWGSVWVAIVP